MAKQESKANGQQQTEQTDEEFTAVGPGAKEGQPGIDQEDEQEDKRGERQEAKDEKDDDDVEERRAGHSDDDVEDDENVPADVRAKRERRRAERKQRKEQWRRDQTELNFLRRRNEDLERRFSTVEQRVNGNEQMTLDARIAQVDDQIREAERVHGLAVEKADGNTATEALRIKDQLIDGKRQLEEAKRRAAATTRARQNGGPARPDPEIARRARDWVTANPWYDPQLRDPDSRVAKSVEEGLYTEGRIDPRSDEYWREYERRLARYLPDKIKARERDRDDEDDEDDEPEESAREQKQQVKKQAGGPTFRTGGRERTLKKGEVYVSAERRAAMEEMGVWDDPDLRKRYLRSYARYDTEAKGRRSN